MTFDPRSAHSEDVQTEELSLEEIRRLSGHPSSTVVRTSGHARGVLMTGRVLAGRYRLDRHLASGGMGDVYEAYDLELQERVALKTIRSALATIPDVLERFTREVKLARKLTHSTICRIFDLGRCTGEAGNAITFLTMEFVEGVTLDDRIREGGIGLDEAVALLAQMVDALEVAHCAGVVHRDFKPANVLLAPPKGAGFQRVVVTDFGLARSLQAEPRTAPITAAGVPMIGTPEYMAPEQVEGAEVSPASDVYALGVVAFEMLTGRLPFDGCRGQGMAIKRLIERPLSPAAFAPHLPEAWTAAILRCLERSPGARFARPSDFLEALVQGGAAELAKARRARRSMRSWLPMRWARLRWAKSLA